MKLSNLKHTFYVNQTPCTECCNFVCPAVDCAVTPFPKISADKLDKMRVRDWGGGGRGVVQSAVESHFALVLLDGRPGESRPPGPSQCSMKVSIKVFESLIMISKVAYLHA